MNQKFEEFKRKIREEQDREFKEHMQEREEIEMDWATVSTDDIIELRGIVRTRAIILPSLILIAAIMFFILACISAKYSAYAFFVTTLLGSAGFFSIGIILFCDIGHCRVEGVPGMTLDHLSTLVEARVEHNEKYATFDGESVVPYPGSLLVYHYGG